MIFFMSETGPAVLFLLRGFLSDFPFLNLLAVELALVKFDAKDV